MNGSGQEALQDVREWSGGPLDFREWSGDPPGCLEMFENPSRMSCSCREAHRDVRVWSGDP